MLARSSVLVDVISGFKMQHLVAARVPRLRAELKGKQTCRRRSVRAAAGIFSIYPHFRGHLARWQEEWRILTPNDIYVSNGVYTRFDKGDIHSHNEQCQYICLDLRDFAITMDRFLFVIPGMRRTARAQSFDLLDQAS